MVRFQGSRYNRVNGSIITEHIALFQFSPKFFTSSCACAGPAIDLNKWRAAGFVGPNDPGRSAKNYRVFVRSDSINVSLSIDVLEFCCRKFALTIFFCFIRICSAGVQVVVVPVRDAQVPAAQRSRRAAAAQDHDRVPSSLVADSIR